MMGSPNATVYRLRGAGLILDNLARVGCCRGAANVNPIRTGSRPAGADAGGGGEGAGRRATDMGRERCQGQLLRSLRERCTASRWVRQTWLFRMDGGGRDKW